MTIAFSDAGELQLVPLEVTALRAAAMAAPQKYSAQSTSTNHSDGADGEVGDGTGCGQAAG